MIRARQVRSLEVCVVLLDVAQRDGADRLRDVALETVATTRCLVTCRLARAIGSVDQGFHKIVPSSEEAQAVLVRPSRAVANVTLPLLQAGVEAALVAVLE